MSEFARSLKGACDAAMAALREGRDALVAKLDRLSRLRVELEAAGDDVLGLLGERLRVAVPKEVVVPEMGWRELHGCVVDVLYKRLKLLGLLKNQHCSTIRTCVGRLADRLCLPLAGWRRRERLGGRPWPTQVQLRQAVAWAEGLDLLGAEWGQFMVGADKAMAFFLPALDELRRKRKGESGASQ